MMNTALILTIALAMSGATTGGYEEYRIETGYISEQNRIETPDGEIWRAETDDMSVNERCIMVYNTYGNDYPYDDEIIWFTTLEEYIVRVEDFRADGLVSAHDIYNGYYFAFEAPDGVEIGNICSLTIYADPKAFEDIIWESAEIIRK